MSLYFIAVTPEPPLSKKIREIQKDFAVRFGSSKSFRSFPHITIIPPFQHDEINESEVVGHFLKSDISIRSFDVKLNGYGSFSGRKQPVVFIKPKQSSELQTLFREMDEIMKGFNYVAHFNPHLTVAYRDLTAENFARAWREYAEKSFTETFSVNRIILYKHFNGKWNELAHRELN